MGKLCLAWRVYRVSLSAAFWPIGLAISYKVDVKVNERTVKEGETEWDRGRRSLGGVPSKAAENSGCCAN
jgi:hypothetical protein